MVPKYDTGFQDETDIRSAVMFPACAGPGKFVSFPDPLSYFPEPQNPLEQVLKGI